MAVDGEIYWVRHDDGVISISLAPPAAIGAASLRFRIVPRFAGLSGFISKTCASGYGNGASGITIVDSGAGRLNVALNAADTSGLGAGAYPYDLVRLDSGYRTQLAAGYFLLREPTGLV